MDESEFRLRRTWPGEDESDFLVLDERANIIGRIYREVATSQGRWLFFVGPGNLPRRADFHGYVETLEEAKARFKELWPQYRAQWSEERLEAALAQQRAAWAAGN
ncbi:hypothetical protein [Bosea robiniae]|uniref:hypothetical protein n=1 Tax=Bosea robiniae TaxID=1036780 RepID=UPI000A8E45CA|nr:hypothetical protein [Bosea robiniae]